MIGKLAPRRIVESEAARNRAQEGRDRSSVRAKQSGERESARKLKSEAVLSSIIARKTARGKPLRILSSKLPGSRGHRRSRSRYIKARPNRRVSPARQIADIVGYIDRSTKGMDRGEVLGAGALNLLSVDRDAQKFEMAATAMGALRARSPILHTILSWGAGEMPERRQAETAVRVLLDELGCGGHQTMWALHRADNVHLHAIINRVAPDAERPTKVSFAHNALARAIARIEHMQGWASVANARFVLLEAEPIGKERGKSEDGRRNGGRNERRNGNPNRGPHAAANNHRQHGGVGEAGGGSVRPRARADDVRVGGIRPDRSAGRRSVPAPGTAGPGRGEARYRSDPNAAWAALAAVCADIPEARRDRLIAAARMRAAHLALPEGRVLARVVDRRPRLSDIAQLVEIRQGVTSAERVAIEVAGPIVGAASSWDDLHRGLARVGLRFVLAGTGAVIEVGRRWAKASVDRGASRVTLEKRLGAYEPPHPSILVAARPLMPAPGVDPLLRTALRDKRRIAKKARDAYDERIAPVAHVAILAEALFGRAPRASADLRRTAAELGLPVPVVAPLRLPAAAPHDPNSLLGRFHAVIVAERYRVIARGVRSAGVDASIFRAGPIDVAALDVGEIRKLEARGAVLSVLVSSGNEEFVVLNRISAPDLARLRSDGFRHRLVTEVEPGSHQVVLTAPRAGTPIDAAAAAVVRRFLSERYNSSDFDGIAPIRLPGSKRTGVGSTEHDGAGVVRIVDAAPGACCALTAELLRRAFRQQLEQFPFGLQASVCRVDPARLRDPELDRRLALYELHRQNIHASAPAALRRPPNACLVDGLIARRLRATGHVEDEVAAVVAAGARRVEPVRQHDWAVYGAHLAAFAFRRTSDAALRRLRPFSDLWRVLEAEALPDVTGAPALDFVKTPAIRDRLQAELDGLDVAKAIEFITEKEEDDRRRGNWKGRAAGRPDHAPRRAVEGDTHRGPGDQGLAGTSGDRERPSQGAETLSDVAGRARGTDRGATRKRGDRGTDAARKHVDALLASAGSPAFGSDDGGSRGRGQSVLALAWLRAGDPDRVATLPDGKPGRKGPSVTRTPGPTTPRLNAEQLRQRALNAARNKKRDRGR